MSELLDNIARLEAVNDELRETVREAHEVRKELLHATKEAGKVITRAEELVDRMDAIAESVVAKHINQVLSDRLPEFQKGLQAHLDRKTKEATGALDKLTKILLGTDGRHPSSLEDDVERFVARRREAVILGLPDLKKQQRGESNGQ